ncbi:cysteine proteinase [Westerdykella ornata]|uniref:ubiquitinyl hydrolase 1 n=1 Tax=Westerdykella ornata TaxID=318751 RepID=A0A6A6JF21_WESOR|nr:cysteine proteinase [Westerdykella ornata]KAF2273779.1 cysteine proteinase [Westerdykella ornata]
MLGAVNRCSVTCYLDALLFAMFARMDSFEAMLFDNFSDEPRKKLAAILRLWVNLLRSGRLIDVELTKHLQEALAKCGWEEAAEVRQQDASEAFTFITGVLDLPLLTLKMDIYHTGREDKEDDHKFVNERLLEVAIPEQEDDKMITLEQCLEAYFNNRIEVKRYLERQNTVGSPGSLDRYPDKGSVLHIETIELSSPSSPVVSTPVSLHPTSAASAPSPARPFLSRRRADSIFTQRYRTDTVRTTSDREAFDEKQHLHDMWDAGSGGRPRAASLRKEVLMPAWQFFSLIPWYTDKVPQSDAQVAAHFSSQRPVLGICLKRYLMLPDGQPRRLGTYIDIPLEIGLPHFVSDDRMDDSGPLFGNFKLVLQSALCHRGDRVDSGHYVSLVRANRAPHSHGTRPRSSACGEHQEQRQQQQQQSEEVENPDQWLLFDDLAPTRVRPVDIAKALKEESPYLLFFQVQPIDEELASRGDPPRYEDLDAEGSDGQTRHDDKEGQEQVEISGNAAAALDMVTSEVDLASGGMEGMATGPSSATLPLAPSDSVAAAGSSMSSTRETTEPDMRSNITIELDAIPLDSEFAEKPTTGAGTGRTTVEVTPIEEKSGWLGTRGRRASKANVDESTTGKSRPPSQSGEGRLSLTLSRLKAIGSKDKLAVMDAATGNHNSNTTTPAVTDDENVTTENEDVVGGERTKSRSKGKEKRTGRLRGKSKEYGPADGNGSGNGGGRREKGRPDRECVVM